MTLKKGTTFFYYATPALPHPRIFRGVVVGTRSPQRGCIEFVTFQRDTGLPGTTVRSVPRHRCFETFGEAQKALLELAALYYGDIVANIHAMHK